MQPAHPNSPPRPARKPAAKPHSPSSSRTQPPVNHVPTAFCPHLDAVMRSPFAPLGGSTVNKKIIHAHDTNMNTRCTLRHTILLNPVTTPSKRLALTSASRRPDNRPSRTQARQRGDCERTNRGLPKGRHDLGGARKTMLQRFQGTHVVTECIFWRGWGTRTLSR